MRTPLTLDFGMMAAVQSLSRGLKNGELLELSFGGEMKREGREWESVSMSKLTLHKR